MQCSLIKLIETLSVLPPHWRIVPVNGNKQPLGYSWQHHYFSPPSLKTSLIHQGSVAVFDKDNELYSVTPKGIGLLCGQTQSEFLVAIDIDGMSAMDVVEKLSAGQGLPVTVAWSSGRSGRAQYLFSIPSQTTSFKSRKISTASGEGFELRGEGHQSVLPPSPHPLTGSYHWLNRPDTTEVAIAPDWVIELLSQPQPPRKHKRVSTPKIPSVSFPSCSITVEQAKLLLEIIHPRYADDYESWIFIGMSLKYISDSLLPDWEEWSQLSYKYQPEECKYKWESFRGVGITERTLHYYAKYS